MLFKLTRLLFILPDSLSILLHYVLCPQRLIEQTTSKGSQALVEFGQQRTQAGDQSGKEGGVIILTLSALSLRGTCACCVSTVKESLIFQERQLSMLSPSCSINYYSNSSSLYIYMKAKEQSRNISEMGKRLRIVTKEIS